MKKTIPTKLCASKSFKRAEKPAVSHLLELARFEL